MVKVKFTTFGANSAFGSFGPGDTLRCSAKLAKHLVDDMKCAKYAEAQPGQEEPQAEKREVKTSKKARGK